MQTKLCIFQLLLGSRMWLWEDLQFIGYLSIKDWGTEHFLGINDWLGEPQAINPCLPLIFRKCPAARSSSLLDAGAENDHKEGPGFSYLFIFYITRLCWDCRKWASFLFSWLCCSNECSLCISLLGGRLLSDCRSGSRGRIWPLAAVAQYLIQWLSSAALLRLLADFSPG